MVVSVPTPMQMVAADGQARPVMACDAAMGGVGVVWRLHVVPFHSSARARVTPPESVYLPVAMHEVADAQTTDAS